MRLNWKDRKMNKENLGKNFFKHGLSKHRLMNIWQMMKRRCYQESHKYYCNYGGRGIGVCEEWRSDFRVFYDWAYQNGYEDSLTIDRIDNELGYCPSNCRWVTKGEQAKNRSYNISINYNGETKILKEWCEYYGMNYKNTHMRMARRGYSFEDCVKYKDVDLRIFKTKT